MALYGNLELDEAAVIFPFSSLDSLPVKLKHGTMKKLNIKKAKKFIFFL